MKVVMDNLIMYLLLEEEEDEEILLQLVKLKNSNAPVNLIFKQRRDEGCYTTLINRHLQQDDVKFREYFRFNKAQFNFLIDLIKNDIKTEPYNRVQYPITAEEQLAIVLR